MTRIDTRKLFERRNALHFTRKEVADRVSVSERYLSDLEHGVKTNPSAILMHDLARVLDAPLEAFFVRDEDADEGE